MSKLSDLLKNVFDTTTDGYAADARALKTLNDRIDGLQVAGTPVVDNLTTESATSALSAKQGKILKGFIDLNAPLADPEFTGTATLNGEPLGINANLNGTSYLLVYGTGTPEENGEELVAAYEEAKKMPRYLGEFTYNDYWYVYKGQTLLYNGVYRTVTKDLLGFGYEDVNGYTSIESKEIAINTRVSIITAPGRYDTTEFPPNISGINIVSLTGRYDVIFNGVPSFGITAPASSPESGGSNIGSTGSFDNLRQLLYRNLEADNMLANIEGHAGNVRPVQTPIKLVSNTNNEYVLENVPRIKGIEQKPTDWMLGWQSDDWSISINDAIKILTAEYIGSVGPHNNCLKVTLNKPTTCPVGRTMVICSFFAGGVTLQWDKQFVATENKNTWNGQIIGCSNSWKTEDGTFRALVTGLGANLSIGKKYITKLHSATDRMGTWTNISGDNTVGVFDELLPPGCVGYTNLNQHIPHPYKVGSYLTLAGLLNSSGIIDKLVIIEYDETLSYKKLHNISIDYTPTKGFSVYGYGLSIAFYKGNFLISVQDGTHDTGKRVLLKSKFLEGPYSLHSVMFDFDTDLYITQNGSSIGDTIANSFIYVFNNELYGFTSGAGIGNTFTAAKHQYYLWKFDDAFKVWNYLKGPIILCLHGDDDNYPDISGSGTTSITRWAKAHMGASYFHYVEGNKIWMGYCAKGWNETSQSSYQATIGYLDLEKALR